MSLFILYDDNIKPHVLKFIQATNILYTPQKLLSVKHTDVAKLPQGSK